MNKLYNIFKNEKDRNPDMTVFYREGNDRLDKSISYTNEEGKLTVLFRKDGKEDFFFRTPETEKGLGDLVQTLENKGRVGNFKMECIEAMPQRFIEIAQSYQFDRKAIGIDRDNSKRNIER